MKEAVKEHARDEFRAGRLGRPRGGMRYVSTDFADDQGEDDVVEALERARRGARHRGQPRLLPRGAAGGVRDDRRTSWGERRSAEGWTRLIIEKPFGHDLRVGQALNADPAAHFSENQVFRIDHYLGKETVQNILALRFANGIFEPIWNRQYIDHVQITVAEALGIEGRAAFYEQAGAIRDMVQNHLLQLLALTAMEPPIDFAADAVRNEKVKVLRSLHTPGPKSVVRGQYGRGFVEGEEVPGYREEEGVAPDSTTETFVAAKLYVDNWRWADVPFYLRTGKRLPRRETTIAIQFKRAPHPPFAEIAGDGLRPNVLLIHVQPDEGISLAIGAKVPGAGMTIRTVHMDFLYGGAFRDRAARGVRAADPRRDARRRDAVHARRRGRGAVGARRRDRRRLEARPAGVPELRRRHVGPARGGRADPPRRPAAGGGIERRSAAGRARDSSASCAREARRRRGTAHERDDARRLGAAGMGGRGAQDARGPRGATPLADDPALPRPEAAGRARRRRRPAVLHRRGPSREVCSDVIELRLRRQAHAGARLDRRCRCLITDLPMFCRWRGLPPWGRRSSSSSSTSATGSSSTRRSGAASPRVRQLAKHFDRIAVSDIAWGRARRLAWAARGRAGRRSRG